MSGLASPEPPIEASEEPHIGYLTDGSFDSSPPMPDADELAAYDSLMRTRMPSITPVDLSWLTEPSAALQQPTVTVGEEGDDEREDEKSMTKAEKQNAKKKRRKERERAARVAAEAQAKGESGPVREELDSAEPLVAFKLFSDHPVQPVSISRPVETYPQPLNPRHQPMSPSMSSKIRQAALSSAVGWDLPIPVFAAVSTGTASDTAPSYPAGGSTTSLDQLPIIRLSAPPQTATPTPNLILILPPHTPIPLPPTKKPKSTPPQTILRAPRLPEADATAPKLSHRQRRRLNRVEPYDTPPARFWAPEVGLGGKARGYAYGWRGSAEGRREGGVAYVRS